MAIRYDNTKVMSSAFVTTAFIAGQLREGMFTLIVVWRATQLTAEQFELIEHVLPTQRGNVRIDKLTLLNAILYVAINGCTWRGLHNRLRPVVSRYDNRHEVLDLPHRSPTSPTCSASVNTPYIRKGFERRSAPIVVRGPCPG